MTELSRQAEPDAICPGCGGQPKHDPEHVLSAVGYLHDDIVYTCSDCGFEWSHGVPIGDYDDEDRIEDLTCDQCGRLGLVHRFEPMDGRESCRIHMKCDDETCHYFWKFERKPDGEGVILLGYPQITGDTDNARESYGY